MRITTSLEFDTFAEAERVFRHLGMLDADKKPGTISTDDMGAHVVHPKANGAAHPQLEAARPAETAPATTEPAVAETTGDLTTADVMKAFQAYVGRAGGRTTKTAQDILRHHGAVENGVASFKYVRPEQLATLKRAFETAGPENPLGAS